MILFRNCIPPRFRSTCPPLARFHLFCFQVLCIMISRVANRILHFQLCSLFLIEVFSVECFESTSAILPPPGDECSACVWISELSCFVTLMILCCHKFEVLAIPEWTFATFAPAQIATNHITCFWLIGFGYLWTLIIGTIKLFQALLHPP